MKNKNNLTFAEIKHIFKNGYENSVNFINSAGEKQTAYLKIEKNATVFYFKSDKNEFGTLVADFNKPITSGRSILGVVEVYNEMVEWVVETVNRFLGLDSYNSRIQQLKYKIENGQPQISKWARAEIKKVAKEYHEWQILNGF